ncbi:RsiW-degrading membrane proteinase PrsW (M82 family) [Elusimicrobium simillimum]|uniref:hypothetical protein n=1 Tax=Elusimicrobium simillimum TaxID=3143438 RepID=UPI003C6EBF0B
MKKYFIIPGIILLFLILATQTSGEAQVGIIVFGIFIGVPFFLIISAAFSSSRTNKEAENVKKSAVYQHLNTEDKKAFELENMAIYKPSSERRTMLLLAFILLPLLILVLFVTPKDTSSSELLMFRIGIGGVLLIITFFLLKMALLKTFIGVSPSHLIFWNRKYQWSDIEAIDLDAQYSTDQSLKNQLLKPSFSTKTNLNLSVRLTLQAHQRITKKRKNIAVLLAVLLIIICAAFIFIYFFSSPQWNNNPPPSAASITFFIGVVFLFLKDYAQPGKLELRINTKDNMRMIEALNYYKEKYSIQ